MYDYYDGNNDDYCYRSTNTTNAYNSATTYTNATYANTTHTTITYDSTTVGFHNFNLRFFNLRVSNPNKLIVDVFLTGCRISMC